MLEVCQCEEKFLSVEQNPYSFVYGLFNVAVTGSDCTVSNCRRSRNYKLEIMWVETVVAYFEAY